LCGTKHDIFSRVGIPRRCLLVEGVEDETMDDRKTILVELGRGFVVKSKILTHFIKGKISLLVMETILVIP
jgi:hypothetical protein